MSTIIEKTGIFDKLILRFVWALAVVKIVLFASFVMIISQTSLVQAENNSPKPPIVCTGKNLITDLEVNNPAALEKIKQKGLKVLNGNSRFWKIEKTGTPTSWLLGTMHFADPRVVAIPPLVEAAFGQSDTVIIENTEVLDQKAMLKAMIELRPMMYLTDGSTLEKHFGEETIARIKNRIKGRGVPYFLGKRMQPWVLATALALPLCEVERKQRKQKVLDYVLGSRARKEGKNLVGLESVKEQIGAMAGLSFQFHIKSLEETLKLGEKIDDVMETMVLLYVQGRIGQFEPLMAHLTPEVTKGPGFDAFRQAMVINRNKTMVSRSLPLIENGNVFMAVGALHLPGKEGVVQLLQNAGYILTPLHTDKAG